MPRRHRSRRRHDRRSAVALAAAAVVLLAAGLWVVTSRTTSSPSSAPDTTAVASTFGGIPGADVSPLSQDDDSPTTVPGAVGAFCQQIHQLYVLRPALKQAYAAGNFLLYQSIVDEFALQTSHLTPIAPSDVAADTQSLVKNVSAFKEVVDRATGLSEITGYMEANFPWILNDAVPWLTWVVTYCPLTTFAP